MPKTHTHARAQVYNAATPQSGYTLNKDGVDLVTHANVATPHTAQNKTADLDQM